jgi:hypothetical protein
MPTNRRNENIGRFSYFSVKVLKKEISVFCIIVFCKISEEKRKLITKLLSFNQKKRRIFKMRMRKQNNPYTPLIEIRKPCSRDKSKMCYDLQVLQVPVQFK